MAERVFIFRGELSEGFFEMGEFKEWVVAKTLVTAGGGGDFAAEFAAEVDDGQVVLASQDMWRVRDASGEVLEGEAFFRE